MKKIFGTLLLTAGSLLSAQYMIIGKDSISLKKFQEEYRYGLENAGVESTVKTAQNFYLYQQFAADKKADTTTAFREKMAAKEAELRSRYFFPAEILDPLMKQFVADNQTERQVQVFLKEKTPGDKTDYRKLYQQVKAGELTIDQAISGHTSGSAEPIYIKPGTLDNGLYSDIKKTANGQLTPLLEAPSYYAFAKVLSTRPSLGYLIFGSVSYPDDASAADTKAKIYAALKSGKSFEEVAKEFGANDHEKQNGGVVLGSPTLPDELYAAFKGQKENFYTPEPLLFSGNYFVFNLYNVQPYQLTEENKQFFLREMNNSLYAELLQDRMAEYLKKDNTYKEFPAFANARKSYAAFAAAKDTDVLYRFKNEEITVGKLRQMMGENSKQAAALAPAVWAEVLQDVNTKDVLRIYSRNFTSLPQVSREMNDFRKGLYSDYIFSIYVKEQMAKHPEMLDDFYAKNPDRFMWEERAKGRVAILNDPKLKKQLAKEMKTAKNWEAVKARFAGFKAADGKAAVTFETGEMGKEAEVFTKYKVPYRTGVHDTQMGSRTLVIAIDELLPPTRMTREEAAEDLQDAVNEQQLIAILEEQRAKTNIVVEPAFLSGLQQNFKK